MKIILLPSAQKELHKIENSIALRISKKIFKLAKNPYLAGNQKLEGGKGYRIRIGNYRVIYQVEKSTKTVTIIKVAHRKEVYR